MQGSRRAVARPGLKQKTAVKEDVRVIVPEKHHYAGRRHPLAVERVQNSLPDALFLYIA
jgi:hypothetical protein